MTENIRTVSLNALCSGCGTCVGICPYNVIEMTTNAAGFLYAKVNEEKCTFCGYCSEVCPSKQHYQIKDNTFYGKCLGSYIGYATDDYIRHESQSGGVVTALLCWLLDRNLIDGAFVNDFNQNTLRPTVVFATRKDQIISASGSYYTQSSVNETILKENVGVRSAAVVLGCQAEGLKKIRETHPNIKLPDYTIGLFCAGQNSGYLIDELVKKTGCDINREKVRLCRLRYKDKDYGGWPGNIHIETNKRTYLLSPRERLLLKPVYELHRCVLCFNKINIFSDIACGDPWGIYCKDKSEGYTVVIARTEKGMKLLKNVENDGAIVLEKLRFEDILVGQAIDKKVKLQFYATLKIFNENGWLHPFCNSSPLLDTPYKISKKEIAFLKRRLSYSRNFYLKQDIPKAKRLAFIKRKQIARKRIISMPINYAKKCVRYIMKKV